MYIYIYIYIYTYIRTYVHTYIDIHIHIGWFSEAEFRPLEVHLKQTKQAQNPLIYSLRPGFLGKRHFGVVHGGLCFFGRIHLGCIKTSGGTYMWGKAGPLYHRDSLGIPLAIYIYAHICLGIGNPRVCSTC